MSCESLEDVAGIGPKRAAVLRQAGYVEVEQLRSASEAAIASIEGIGPSVAERIKQDVGDEPRHSTSIRVHGRVRNAADEAGVHGLEVEIWEREVVADKIGTVRTGADGAFAFASTETKHVPPGDGRPRIALRFRDRTGSVIHTTENDPRRVELGEVVAFDLQIDAERLADHLETPTSWTPPAEGLVPDAHLADIREAVGLLRAPHESGYNALRQAALCPLPPLAKFGETIFDDAWGTLRGDPGAERRFADALETTMAFDLGACSNGPGGVPEDVVTALFEPDKQALSRVTNPRPGQGGADAERVVGPDKAVPLTMAAMRLGGDDPELGMAYVGTVLDQFCGAEFMGAVHRSALDALRGREGAIERWGGHLGAVGVECGPDDGPIPEFPPKRVPRCPPPPNPCAVDVVRTLRDLGPAIFGGSYTVTDVTPARACAGEVVVIRGSGFGEGGGDVYLGGEEAEVRSWSNTAIEVEVPAGAGCGLNLSIKEDTIEVCGRFVDVYKRGTFHATFDGSSPRITDLRANGEKRLVCVRPDTTARISWETCAVDELELAVIDEDGGVIATHDPGSGTGHWDYDVPDATRTRELTVRATAEGECPPYEDTSDLELIVHKVPAPTVQGMEVTQAIQHYGAAQHLTDASDRGTDNSLQLVANKPAWVRVYVRSGQDPGFNGGDLEDVTGTLTVERRSGGSWSTVASIPAANAGGTMTAADAPSYAAERGDITRTLNFVIPGNQFRGELRLSVDSEAPDPCVGTLHATDTTRVTVDLRQRLRVAGIMVSYNGPDGAGGTTTLAAPTLGNLRATAAQAYTMMPVASPRAVDFRISGTITWTQPLTDPAVRPGGCSNNWLALNAAVRNVMTADATRAGWVFYGLLPNGIPMGPVIGCGGGAVGTGANGNQGTMVHEVGHAVGLAHGPCGTPGDPNYPAYEPYDPLNTPGARLGPYGLDITDGTIHPPQERDYMSYCGPTWISKYHHNQQLNLGRLNATPVSGRARAAYADGGGMGTQPADGAPQAKPYVSLTGFVREDGAVVVETVARVRTRADLLDGEPTDLRAELLEDGEVVAGATVFSLDQHAQGECGCGEAPDEPPYVFQALIDDRVLGDELRIREDDDVRWRQRAPDEPPQIERFALDVGETDLEIDWEARTGLDRKPEAWLRYSDDEGETWQALTVGVRDERTTLDISHLSGTVQLQLLVHDGFSTVEAISEPIQLPERGPSATIMHPQDGDTVPANSPMRLWAVAAIGGEDVPDEAFTWSLDGQVVAEGSDVYVDAPQPGTHELELAVTAEGEAVTETTTVTVTDRIDAA